MTMTLLLAAILASAPGAAPKSPPPFALQELSPGVFAAIAGEGDAAGGNAGFVVGSDGVLVVDAFATEAAAEALLAAIREKTSQPVRFVVDTHGHLDHVGGNAVFARAGAAILSQENARRWMRREWQTDLPAERRERLAKLRLPDVTYRDGVTLWLGDRRVDVTAAAGHSGGDSLVSVPGARVVFAGDLVAHDAIPNLADARTEAWIATLDGLLREQGASTFVPGHGPPSRPLDVRGFRDFLASLRRAVARARAEGKSGDALVASVRAELSTRYARWTRFDGIDRAITAEAQEQAGTKEFPPASP